MVVSGSFVPNWDQVVVLPLTAWVTKTPTSVAT